MSKELDTKLLKTLKGICENIYHRPTEFNEQSLASKTQSSVFEISHSINNLQREGFIKVHMGSPGKLSKVELLKQE